MRPELLRVPDLNSRGICIAAKGALLKIGMRPGVPRVTDLNSRGVCIAAKLDRQREAGSEDGQRAQLAREHKVKKAPQLCQVVLDGRARHDDPMYRRQLLCHKRDLHHSELSS